MQTILETTNIPSGKLSDDVISLPSNSSTPCLVKLTNEWQYWDGSKLHPWRVMDALPTLFCYPTFALQPRRKFLDGTCHGQWINTELCREELLDNLMWHSDDRYQWVSTSIGGCSIGFDLQSIESAERTEDEYECKDDRIRIINYCKLFLRSIKRLFVMDPMYEIGGLFAMEVLLQTPDFVVHLGSLDEDGLQKVFPFCEDEWGAIVYEASDTEEDNSSEDESEITKDDDLFLQTLQELDTWIDETSDEEGESE